MKARKKTKEILTLFIICFISGLGIATSTLSLDVGDIIYVDDDNTEGPWDGTQEYPFQHIQDGINAATYGDTVFVYNGTYIENVQIFKSLNLIGEDKNITIIDGNSSGDVISINANSVTVKGFTIQNSGDVGWSSFDSGIDIRSDYNAILGNIVTDNLEGIYLYEASNNNISGNIISLNYNGFFSFTQANNNTIFSNEIVENNIYGIYIVNSCENNTVANNMIVNNDEGITIYASSFNEIVSNTITDTYGSGIELAIRSDRNVISRNTITNNEGHGIVSAIIFENNFSDNIIMNNGGFGIYSHQAAKNEYVNNIISENHYGIYLEGSMNNTIIENNISYNAMKGISLIYCDPQSSDFNKIYHNTFINNENAYDQCSNIWDYGYPSGGNYWNDYDGEDNDGDGIGDIPYNISGGINQDSYPLMYPFGEEPPTVEITKPKELCLYIRNREIMQFFATLIFGKIDVVASVTIGSSEIDYVEFYINDVLTANISQPPYEMIWDERVLFRHTINVIAFDNNGNSASDKIIVWKFF